MFRYTVPAATLVLASGLFIYNLAPSFAADATGGAQVVKYGVVDLQHALETVEEGKKAKAQLQKDVTSKQAALEKQRNALQKEAEEFDKKAAIMNETARAARQAELQKKFAEFQKTYGESQMDVQKRERDLTKPIIDALRAVVEGIGKAENFSLVFERNEGAILYARDATDLTARVIEAYNKKGKKG
ncbi:OmpH family outer membrane protein [bacterium]|nr:OmpH family outer membrane protein [bacterium]